ncbi:hypothetical protein D0Z07_6466 [Hyphodiscus hymeniophilus]|uniref:Caspase domain-containing protein n=1 Tax=Hyphodiscus hymeniophilus TaxID=353542 RepID=A0A9P6VFE9_9HELO|nr:hypothetical protein D0Z07_6466 [Hyphodiscus hymeniophilus]
MEQQRRSSIKIGRLEAALAGGWMFRTDALVTRQRGLSLAHFNDIQVDCLAILLSQCFDLLFSARQLASNARVMLEAIDNIILYMRERVEKGSLHDTSRARYHIRDIGEFAADLNDAAKSAFPNRGRSRYNSVNVCLIRWQEDELQVQNELGRLDHKFQDYGFKTDVWMIPSQNSHLELMSKSIDAIRTSDNDQNLFIIYYAGHGRINEARQAEWTCRGRDPNYASVDWSAIQSLFAKARSDVLVLLGTCAAASSTMRSQYGVMEAIVACGFESKAPPPGEHSFTNTLIEVLDDWIKRPAFSASCLHAEILFQLKLKETRKGREGIKLEWCVTPIHINYTQDSKAPAIELSRRNILPTSSTQPDLIPRNSTYDDAMDIDFDEANTAPTKVSTLTSSGEFQIPHVLIKVGLELDQPPLDAEQCLKWLQSIPLLA